MSSHQPIPPWSLKDPWNEWPEGQEFPRWRPAPPGAYPREAAPTNETPSKSATSSQLPSRRSQTPPRQTSPVQAPCSQESPRQASTRTATPQPASSANPQRKREREGSSHSLREQLLKKLYKTNKSSQQTPNVPKADVRKAQPPPQKRKWEDEQLDSNDGAEGVQDRTSSDHLRENNPSSTRPEPIRKRLMFAPVSPDQMDRTPD
jgi:hypothetical protein